MKVISLFFFTCLTFSVFSQETREVKSDSLILFAKTQLGTPYKYATSNPNVSFDCSGFTSYVYSNFDVTKCRVSRGYEALGEKIDQKDALPGDCILFYGTAPGSKTIGHVGIVVENGEDGIQFIHCSSSKKHGGVVISSLNTPGYTKRFSQIRRLF